MDRWKIVNDVIDILKLGGALTQDPYRADLFARCRAAYDAGPTDGMPSLAPDGLLNAIRARWPDAATHEQRLRDLSAMWRARSSAPRRRSRTTSRSRVRR